MKEETIRLVVGSVSDNLKGKFRIDEKGFWYNERLELEAARRNQFTESRRINGKMGGRPKAKPKPKQNHKVNHTDNRMENENRNEDENRILNEYEDWTLQILDNNEQYFETMMINEGPKLTPETFTLLVRSHLTLLNRYPKMRPPNQQAFRRSLIGFLIENKDKKINGNGQDLNKNQQHLHNLATDYYNTYGPKAKGG